MCVGMPSNILIDQNVLRKISLNITLTNILSHVVCNLKYNIVGNLLKTVMSEIC